MHGCGNDFLIIDNRAQAIVLSSSQITELADYKKSIGFDQLLFIENSDLADVAIKIFNKDGSEAQACGNGSRCVARLILQESGKQSISIATVNRILTAKWQNNLVAIDMGKAGIVQKAIQFCDVVGALVEIGNPHVIINDPNNLDILKYGPLIENDSRFPGKVNVNFVQVINADLLHLRTWERGVGATLACGSGACASFYFLHTQGFVNKKAVIKQPGGEVVISIEGENIIMAGEAEISYSGSFKVKSI